VARCENSRVLQNHFKTFQIISKFELGAFAFSRDHGWESGQTASESRLEETLRGRSHNILIGKPQGKWSAQEHAGHLLDLETLWLARVGDYVVASDQLTATDLKNRKTDEANHNARPLEQILTEFRAEREKLLKRVDDLDASIFTRSIPHPRLLPARFRTAGRPSGERRDKPACL
jgi:hypothetical protein